MSLKFISEATWKRTALLSIKHDFLIDCTMSACLFPQHIICDIFVIFFGLLWSYWSIFIHTQCKNQCADICLAAPQVTHNNKKSKVN